MTSSTAAERSLLELKAITLDYKQGIGRKPFRALDSVDLHVGFGETVGLVGESGSGKTSLARVVLGLQPPTSGSIVFDGHDLTHASRRQWRASALDLQAVFQDPYSSLNPALHVGASVAEPLRRRGDLSGAQIRERVVDMLEGVGLTADAVNRFPNHFSGGQRQRIAIARALIVSPQLVVCDEPVSALDLSVQAQVINLLTDLQESLKLSYLFIAHDLSVVRVVSQRIVVMHDGKVVETGTADQVYRSPRHEYTQRLLASIPDPDPDSKPSLAAPLRGVGDSARPVAFTPTAPLAPVSGGRS